MSTSKSLSKSGTKKAPMPSLNPGGTTQSVRGAKGKYGSRHVGGTSVTSSIKKRDGSDGLSPSAKFSLPRIPIQVFDEDGNNVTPLPLVAVDPASLHGSGIPLAEGSLCSPSDVLSQWSTDTSAFGGGPFSRSVFTQSTGTMESVADEETSVHLSTWADIRQEHAEVKEVITESDLDKVIYIDIIETDTIWMLDIPTVCVAADTKEAEEVDLDNSVYAKLCKSRAGNDLYTERGMNTFNEAPKFKAVQTTKISYADAGVSCTNWTMYDTFQEAEKESKETDQKEDEDISHLQEPAEEVTEDRSTKTSRAEYGKSSLPKQHSISSRKQGSQTPTVSSSTFESGLFGDTSKDTAVTLAPSDVSSLGENRIMKSESLRKDLFVMERVINLNSYQPKLALYRGLQVISDIDQESSLSQITANDMGPNLDRLWAYFCPPTKGHNVSCLAWNKINPDLIAVGYGQFEFTAQKSGLICCWCLKNPEFPERIYTSKYGVTALDFSTAHPNILAVGYYDGGVAIYNVRSVTDEPLLDSQRDTSGSGSGDAVGDTDLHNRHLGPVWELQWVHKETREQKAEVIISISTDGHVTQWNIRKGFECHDIMLLKKTPTRMAGKPREKHGEAIISRYAGGLCFDFDRGDANLYLAGTEEGYVHKCSCSYNEQYLETYTGHSGPVYRVRWSPFLPDIFLSCSADWSMCLWDQNQNEPLITFHSSTKAVNDVCWSPRSSTVFACVNEGAAEVWDLTQSILDPVITVTPTYGSKLTSLTFCKNTECILMGDSEGQVTVYELRCMPPVVSEDEQKNKLTDIISALMKNQLSTDEKHIRIKNTPSQSQQSQPEASANILEAVVTAAEKKKQRHK